MPIPTYFVTEGKQAVIHRVVNFYRLVDTNNTDAKFGLEVRIQGRMSEVIYDCLHHRVIIAIVTKTHVLHEIQYLLHIWAISGLVCPARLNDLPKIIRDASAFKWSFWTFPLGDSMNNSKFTAYVRKWHLLVVYLPR
jgi:hypothetical protein